MPPTDRPRIERSAARGDIQGLRAVAVLLVVLSHAGVAGLAGGYVGVDVFFVISGFLITGILVREVDRSGRVSVLDFYARRARRILPAAAVVLLVVTIASWAALGYLRVAEVLVDVTWASFFAANVRATLTHSDYFAGQGFLSPVQHFWSLAVEEQFYLVWPVLVGVVALRSRHHLRRNLVLTMSLLGAASLAWCVHRTGTVPTAAYFSTFTRAWELGAGALLALAAPHLRQCTRGFLGLCSWAGLALIAYAGLTFTDTTPFPGTAALLPVAGSLLVLAGGVRATPRGASLLLDRAPMRRVGDLSYSLYLWHWPLLVIPAAALGSPLGPVNRLLLVLAAVALAALTYRFVETPVRDGGFWRRGRARSLALWPAALASVLSGVVLAGSGTAGVADAAVARVDPQQPTGDADTLLAVEHAAARAKAGAPLPRHLTPSPRDLHAANWRLPPRCWAGTRETEHEICTMGDRTADRTLALYGDSHIGMWTAPIVKIAARTHWKVVLLLKTGCPPIDIEMWRPRRPDGYVECDAWRRWAHRRLVDLAPRRIITTGYTSAPVLDPGTGERLRTDTTGAGTDALVAGMRSALARLTAITPHVTVLGDTTTLPRPATDCLGLRGATLGTCAADVAPATAAHNARWRTLTRAAGAFFVDVTPWLCADDLCPLVVGNVVVYTDRHHLTRRYAATLVPVLRVALRL